MLRKVFNYNNHQEFKIVQKNNLNVFENNISACGCLFYKTNTTKSCKNVELLLIKYEDKNWPRLDDFGGQIDISDEDIISAIHRETAEETNDIISFKQLRETKDAIVFYNKKSKYYLYLIKVDESFYKDTEIFGNLEKAENIKRTINWYNYKEHKNSLSYRLLACEELIAYLDNLS